MRQRRTEPHRVARRQDPERQLLSLCQSIGFSRRIRDAIVSARRDGRAVEPRADGASGRRNTTQLVSAAEFLPKEVKHLDILDRTMFSNQLVEELFSDRSYLEAMLRVEAALVLAQAEAGVIPVSAAERIVEACQSGSIRAERVFGRGAAAGTPVIPLIREIEAIVGPDAAGYVHFGATTQDIMDTALMDQMRAATQVIRDEVVQIVRQCHQLTRAHRDTLMMGRTLGQHAIPMTFGLKTARWLGSLLRDLERIDKLKAQGFFVQFGGAVGTLASLGPVGLEVSRKLAATLELEATDQPWHAERDRIADIVSVLAILVGSLAKIATDIILLSQTEVGEVSEGGGANGGSGSSTLPHKRNPGNAVRAQSASRLALAGISSVLTAVHYEHERAAGHWQAEWAHIPNVFRYTAGCASLVRASVDSLIIDQNRMRENISATRGAIMAEALSLRLAPMMGRSSASALVSRLCDEVEEEQVTLFDVASRTPEVNVVLSDFELSDVLDPSNYLGSTASIIDGALKQYTELLDMERDDL